MKRWRIVLAVLVLALPAALARDDDPADARARELAAQVVEEPSVPAKAFDKAFLAAVPAEKVAKLLADMWQEGGKVVSVKRLSGDRHSGKFLLEQERGTRTECTIGVHEKAPHQIATLWLK